MEQQRICTSYVILRFPLIVFGWHLEVKEYYVALGICTILYNIQFCFHFIIYAVVQNDYRNAYFDILNLMFPCNNKCRASDNNNDT